MAVATAYAVVAPRPDRDHFSISDLSAEFGVTARALRFYEDEGLIAPDRRGTQAHLFASRPGEARLDFAWQARGGSASPKSGR